MKLNSMIKLLALTAMSFIGIYTLNAQTLPDTVKPVDRELLRQQATDLYKIIDPISAKFSPSVVAIKSRNRIIAMGTVTEKGIITKLSEIARRGADPRIIDHLGNENPVILKDSNEEYDLVLLENPKQLAALPLKQNQQPKLGSILIAAGAAEQALSMGVVSVTPRSLKESDRGFLGVVMDLEENNLDGVLLMRVEDQTAASRAGLQAGDVITKINDTDINNMIEMRNLLQKQKPGDIINVSYLRDGQIISGVKVTLGGRPEIPRVRGSRMNQMKRMGGKVNAPSLVGAR